MKVYQDIELCPNAEISPFFLWEKVFQQLHLALVEIQDDQGHVPIGVSFPEYDNRKKVPLGLVVRVFAPDEATLKKLALTQWLERLGEYVNVPRVRSVPDDVQKYACYQRQQPKSNVERLARRKAKRQNISFEQALASFGDFTEQSVTTPYIQMKSQSSQQRFRLFIAKKQMNKPHPGNFSTYGLSLEQATVPEF